MNRRKQNKASEAQFKSFIERRKDLSSFDKKMEAAKFTEQSASVDVDNAYRIVSSKINYESKIRTLLSSITRIAAVFSIPLLAFTIWSLFFQEDKTITTERAQTEITWQEIQSPVGMRSHVVLPDGTNLWLNAGSRLRYGIPFTRKKREVELSGEAFLDVAKNEQSPFVVTAGNAEVEVLGTQFNVNTWPEREQIHVALKEGKVKFRFAGDDGISKYCEMEPNDLLEFNRKNKTVSLKNTNIEKYIAWHRNIMILDDTPITELARLLEQWYGVKVIIADDDIMGYKFTTTFYNEPLHRVLELLEISSPEIAIVYTPGEKLKNKDGFAQSIVTITQKKMPM